MQTLVLYPSLLFHQSKLLEGAFFRLSSPVGTLLSKVGNKALITMSAYYVPDAVLNLD